MGWIAHSGTSGIDHSANASAVPIAGYQASPLLTIAANLRRNFVEVQNQSAVTIQVVRDDGAGNNQTSILLGSGGSAGTQGATFTSYTFKGRIRVFSQNSTDQVAAYEE